MDKFGSEFSSNKKVLLRERKRHATRRTASVRCANPYLPWPGGVTYPWPGRGVPNLARGTPPPRVN